VADLRCPPLRFYENNILADRGCLAAAAGTALTSEYFKRAWTVALVSSIAMAFGGPTINLGIVSLFMKPVSHDLGWGRGTFSLLSGALMLGLSLSAPFVGMAVDRWGARRIVLVGNSLFGLSIMALSQLTTFVPLLVAIGIMIGCSAAAKGPVPYTKILSTWFSTNRGFVLGLVLGVAHSIGFAVVPSLGQFLLTNLDWRHAFIAFGLVVGVITTLPSLLLPREPVEKPHLHESNREIPAHVVGMTARQALMSRTFWLLATSVLISASSLQTLRLHMAALFDDRGLSKHFVVAALAIGPIAGVGGQLLSGVILDRTQTGRVIAPFFFAGLVGAVMLSHTTDKTVLMIGVAILGIAATVETVVLPYFLSRYFGLRSFSAIFGYCLAMYGVISSVSLYLMGLSYDVFHSYSLSFTIIEIFLAIGAIGIALLPRYAYGASATMADHRRASRT